MVVDNIEMIAEIEGKLGTLRQLPLGGMIKLRIARFRKFQKDLNHVIKLIT